MDKLACIAVSTVACLFVVLADVWLVVKNDCGPHMLAGSQGPVSPSPFLTAYRLLSPETLLVVCVVVETFVQCWTASDYFVWILLSLL